VEPDNWGSEKTAGDVNRHGRERPIYWFALSRAGSWFFARTLHLIDRFVFRISNGRMFATSALSGLPIVMLTTTGAKSGRRRTVPLVGIQDGDKVVLIASFHGNTHHPAGYHNLRVHLEVTITIHGRMKTTRLGTLHRLNTIATGTVLWALTQGMPPTKLERLDEEFRSWS
jgi:deazaflavin-dependent oxidoreductase (nitroreductase family)